MISFGTESDGCGKIHVTGSPDCVGARLILTFARKFYYGIFLLCCTTEWLNASTRHLSGAGNVGKPPRRLEVAPMPAAAQW